MLKKTGVIIILGLMIISIGFSIIVSAQIDSDEIGGDAGKILNATEKLRDITQREKWEFLADEWKKVFMENKAFNFFNNLMEKMSIVFLIIFGTEYDFSPLFFMTIILWFFTLYLLHSLAMPFLPFGKGVQLIISVGIMLAFAQFGLRFFVELVLNVLLWGEGIWRIVGILLGFLFLFVIVILVKNLKRIIREYRETEAKMQEAADRRDLHTTAEAVREGTRNEF